MGIIEDAYQFGEDNALRQAKAYGIMGIAENLVKGQEIATQLIPQFFADYIDYRYVKSNADLVFQAIYFAVMNKITDQLKQNIQSEFSKFKSQNMSIGVFNETTKASEVKRIVETRGTPLQKITQNYSISIGHSPDSYAMQQLEQILSYGDQVARMQGLTQHNINWSEIPLYIQPGMDHIPPENMEKIMANLWKSYAEPTIQEKQKNARFVYTDQRYNLTLVWYGGRQIQAFYNDKELGSITLSNAPVDSKDAKRRIAWVIQNYDNYPEVFANDQETYNQLLNLKKGLF